MSQSALHALCDPFHCLHHHSVAMSSEPASHSHAGKKGAACVVEFADRSWAEQFVAVHQQSMNKQQHFTVEYVDHRYVERHRRREADTSGGKELSGKQQRRLSASVERESGVEDGEVDSDVDDDTEVESARASRIARQYDLSSLESLTGSAVSRVLVASSLPADYMADDPTLVRYAFAPFVHVQWVHIDRLRSDGRLVALVALQTLLDSQTAMAKAGQINIAQTPLTLHYARKATPSRPDTNAVAVLAPSPAAPAAAAAAPSLAPLRPSHIPPSFSWHESGYWVDSPTGLMYHAASGLYYDAIRQHYLAFNSSTKQYVVMPDQLQYNQQQQTTPAALLPSTRATATTPAETASGSSGAAAAVATSSSVKPIRFGLKTALDASSSAAAMRPAKAAIFVQPADPPSAQPPSQPTMQATQPVDDEQPGMSVVQPSADRSQSVAAAPAVAHPASSSLLVDYFRLACLLCQRGFASVDQLKRHVEQSALHSRNVQLLATGKALQQQATTGSG